MAKKRKPKARRAGRGLASPERKPAKRRPPSSAGKPPRKATAAAKAAPKAAPKVAPKAKAKAKAAPARRKGTASEGAGKPSGGSRSSKPQRKPTRKPARGVSGPTKPTKPPAKPPRRTRRFREQERERERERERKRIERRAIAEAAAVRHEEQLARRRAHYRQRKEREAARREGRPEVADRDVAIGWLEAVREHAAATAPCSLSITVPEAVSVETWLVVGRFDFVEPVGYAELGRICHDVVEDYILSARVNPGRLTQLRILYDDPSAPKRGGDSIVSRISGWEFTWGDVAGEINGGRDDDADALAVRYEHTQIQTFYVYIAPTTITYSTAPAFAKTVALPINYQRKD